MTIGSGRIVSALAALVAAGALASAAEADPASHNHDYLAVAGVAETLPTARHVAVGGSPVWPVTGIGRTIVTDHSAGQNGAGRPSVPIVTEHSAGQNGDGSAPAAGGQPTAAPVAATPADGFAWGDAAIGAGAAMVLLFLLAGGATVIVRRRGTPAYR
ncbi:MAG TPA: hypothetical protein VH416_00035 [Gaiellaceae bacterium]|jgi:hypothetical protein